MDNHQAVPKSPQLEIKAYSLRYKAIQCAPHSTPNFTHVPTSVASRAGDYS
jgi:hypothetical protein